MNIFQFGFKYLVRSAVFVSFSALAVTAFVATACTVIMIARSAAYLFGV